MGRALCVLMDQEERSLQHHLSSNSSELLEESPRSRQAGDAPTTRNLLLAVGALSASFPAASRLPAIPSDLLFPSFWGWG